MLFYIMSINIVVVIVVFIFIILVSYYLLLENLLISLSEWSGVNNVKIIGIGFVILVFFRE